LGADLVLDIKLAEDLALLESQNEFIERYNSAKASKIQTILPMLASSCPGKVIKNNKSNTISIPMLCSPKIKCFMMTKTGQLSTTTHNIVLPTNSHL